MLQPDEFSAEDLAQDMGGEAFAGRADADDRAFREDGDAVGEAGGEVEIVHDGGDRGTLGGELTQETPILLVDEEDGGFLGELAAEGAAIAAVMHDLNLAAGFADRVAVLSKGAVVGVGPPRESLAPHVLREVFGAEFIWLEHPALERPVLAQAGRGAPPGG